MIFASHGKAGAATAYSEFAVLNSSAPSGITVIDPQDPQAQPEVATPPVWLDRAPAGVSAAEIATARPVPVDVPRLRVWAAKSTTAGSASTTWRHDAPF